ncbi:protein-disulfide isomerase [Rhizobium binae]|uniref:Protein-disulfide isomerase n=1 Tax=Rhizobium binae TaxID=1138190 RepID=A0ABV2MS77_9HYPH|nr:DsbA family protein [Rhizobium binae]MBX4994792.1 thioredoxin domain-containing protein [Rhizobium binae]NKL52649.1 thioredoxin domain-containing protein [Rhizobium leguminosarum bv. viciae]QSY85322.1 thioredoxin domain-containing protein [Rhizobium binae]
MFIRRQFLSIATGGVVAAVLAPRPGFAQQLSEDEVFRDPDAPVLGNPRGDVTVVEFFDYQCPYCKKSHPDVESVVTEDGNVRLIMKDWPVFGDVSVFASQAVLGANELGAYKQAMEALMATPASLSQDDVKRLLTSAGLDRSKVAEAVRRNDKKISNLLTRNYNQATAFNFAGTPSFVIGKMTYSGVLGTDQLRDAIRQARTT